MLRHSACAEGMEKIEGREYTPGSAKIPDLPYCSGKDTLLLVGDSTGLGQFTDMHAALTQDAS